MKKYQVHAITGNHDCYYKNTNEINSPELLLNDYTNIKTYSKATDVNIGGLDILLLPWISMIITQRVLKQFKILRQRLQWDTLRLMVLRQLVDT